MSAPGTSSTARVVGIVILVIGILAIVAGVVYLSEPAGKLPSFFPGHLANSTLKHSKRGIAGVVVGIVLLIVGALLALRRRRAA